MSNSRNLRVWVWLFSVAKLLVGAAELILEAWRSLVGCVELLLSYCMMKMIVGGFFWYFVLPQCRCLFRLQGGLDAFWWYSRIEGLC